MVEAKNLSMFYGPTKALDSVSFRVAENEVVGLLGPNGAGKTTIMRILTTFIYPTSGTASVCGIDVTNNPIQARQNIGYLPESPPLYMDMRVDEFIDFVGRARGLSGRKLAERKDWGVEACGVKPVWKHQMSELSLGFRQRVGIFQALIHDPKVVILDEPTSGLDPIQIIGVRNLIRDLAKTKTVLFSTHILQEASAVSQRLFIINQGKIVAQGTTAELQGGAKKEELIYLSADAPKADLENALAALKPVKRAVFVDTYRGAPRFSISVSSFEEAAREISNVCHERKWLVKEFSSHEASLEEVFVEFFKRSKGKVE